jgi:hypothetical protein
VADIIEIGRRLTEAKQIAGHGNWLPWLEREFGWSEDTAQRFMSLHRLHGDVPQIAEYDLPVSGLYLLARPSTPAPVREEITNRAADGEHFTHAQVKEMVSEGTAKLRREYENKISGLTEQMESAEARIRQELQSDAADLEEQIKERMEAITAPIRRELDEWREKFASARACPPHK